MTQPAVLSEGAGSGAAEGAHRFEKAVGVLQWITIFFGAISFFEPSPGDIFFLVLILLWFFNGFSVHAAVIPIIAIMLVRIFSEVFMLFPYMTDPDATSYVFYSAVVTVIFLFFVLFFSNNTKRRVEIFLNAYLLSCVFASAFAIVGYFDIAGLQDKLAPAGRALGTFKDPNVMGSYCTLGAAYAMQLVLLKKTRHTVLAACAFFFISAGVLLTFSRGSWGALVVSVLMLVYYSFATNKSAAVRGRVAKVFLALTAMVVAGLLLALSNSDFRELLFQRAALVQEYDGGETGRFGNQIRSIPLILDRLWTGLGPLQYRKVFDLEPHNAYIGGFANSGIFGGFAFIGLVLTTSFVGFRLCWRASPYQQMAHVIWPPMLGHFIQAFQIDIDHWRFFYVVLAAVWGLEVARQRWVHRLPPTIVHHQAAAGRTARASMSA